jgi:hypothetical protein
MKDLLIKSIITVISLAVISLVFIFAETLPIVSFVIMVLIILFIISMGVLQIIEGCAKDKDNLTD